MSAKYGSGQWPRGRTVQMRALVGDDVNELRDEDGLAFGTKLIEVAQGDTEGRLKVD